jgi:hypothetical protein
MLYPGWNSRRRRNMAETTVPNYQKGLTFEDVWASLTRTSEELRELGKETDRRMKETGRYINKIDKQIGGLNRCSPLLKLCKRCLAHTRSNNSFLVEFLGQAVISSPMPRLSR